jgi:uncharacterized ferritin-like protein (DUF455 family)
VLDVSKAVAAILTAADPYDKVRVARHVARAWRLGKLDHAFSATLPDRPARPAEPRLLPPNRMPKRGRMGSFASRVAMIHALAHIEFVAIDLAFDLLGRFGAQFPPAFVDDWMRVGAEEAMHFVLLDRRLRALGSHYGALPAHDGLWQAAAETAHDPLARLAVVPMVLEARGLDITPATIERFAAVGDQATTRILTRILRDEERHVRAGTCWFRYACESAGLTPAETWRTLVARHFRGELKPPFNDSARARAGLTRDFYMVGCH